MAKNEDDLQRQLHRFQRTAEKCNNKISLDKTDYPTNYALYVLGVEINSWKNVYREVQNQANKPSRISGCLRDIVWKKNTYMQPKVSYVSTTTQRRSGQNITNTESGKNHKNKKFYAQ